MCSLPDPAARYRGVVPASRASVDVWVRKHADFPEEQILFAGPLQNDGAAGSAIKTGVGVWSWHEVSSAEVVS